VEDPLQDTEFFLHQQEVIREMLLCGFPREAVGDMELKGALVGMPRKQMCREKLSKVCTTTHDVCVSSSTQIKCYLDEMSENVECVFGDIWRSA